MKMKRIGWTMGGVVLLALLAGAAYMGARLWAQNPSDPNIQVTPAPELPAAAPDVAGLFVRREDQSLFVGTGQISMVVSSGPDADTLELVDSSYNGPVMEVVINRDTAVYRETTELPESFTGDVVLQQTVEVGSVDEIGENSVVQVWGRKSGDRIVAETLVYQAPLIQTSRSES
jgi:hypothetical protein